MLASSPRSAALASASTSPLLAPSTLTPSKTKSAQMATQSQLSFVHLDDGWTQFPSEHSQLNTKTSTQEEVASLPARRLTCFHKSSNLQEKLRHGTSDALNAILAYSRGQLALAPCNQCRNSYEATGYAMPFQDCVLLPTYWGFACASCIARSCAAECSFKVIQQTCLDQYWQETAFKLDNLDLRSRVWLEQGHPLVKFDFGTEHKIWIRRSGTWGPKQVLQAPTQYGAFILPPRVRGALLPIGFHRHSDDYPSRVGDLLRTKQNIILITGAGVSASTGIPTYQAALRSSRSSQVVYHPSAYSTEESAEMLHADILAKFETGLSASLTPFDRFVEYLAGTERIRRHFTQNIDCRHTRLPYLSKQTVWLHGRSDTLMCSKSSEHKFRVNPEGFRSMVMAACSLYQREQLARIAVGKRARGVGLLRPNILLYGEDCTNEENILDTMHKDLDHPVDAVLIVGTRLQIPSLRDFAVRLCERVSNKGGLVAWVNNEPMQARLRPVLEPWVNFNFLGDCDTFASSVFS